MIKATKDTKADAIKMIYQGDIKDKESEIIAILISALNDFSVKDLEEMLQLADQYKNNGKSGYFIFNE